MRQTLIRSIKRKLSKEDLRDVCRHGAGTGWPEFTYYSDTCAFFRRHRAAIVELAEEMAVDLGEGVLEMIQSFNCLKDQHYSTSEIGKVLYGRWDSESDAHTQVGNALAWFALEEVARYLNPDI